VRHHRKPHGRRPTQVLDLQADRQRFADGHAVRVPRVQPDPRPGEDEPHQRDQPQRGRVRPWDVCLQVQREGAEGRERHGGDQEPPPRLRESLRPQPPDQPRDKAHPQDGVLLFRGQKDQGDAGHGRAGLRIAERVRGCGCAGSRIWTSLRTPVWAGASRGTGACGMTGSGPGLTGATSCNVLQRIRGE
jgi:hypothetical protein